MGHLVAIFGTKVNNLLQQTDLSQWDNAIKCGVGPKGTMSVGK